MKCHRCEKEAVVSVGKEKTPLCQEHFDMVLRGVKKAMRRFEKATNTKCSISTGVGV